ncbi:hypothetical protein COL26b_014266 [Colletotrichum chrysophilum]|uniref:uncharacterized protein n=1 Tax=Colletotrichum chrysophilum TaxID=1836956 RepID=UPI002301173C|nr:uncharacterized protein COL26b_014266 [Colletotrichum chrysophilum]KAJ0359771.1 hypothetical protein COL26b_014266 [Colletotrichum chrysophilum]
MEPKKRHRILHQILLRRHLQLIPPEPELHRIPLVPVDVPRRHAVQQRNRALAPRNQPLHRILIVGPHVDCDPGHARERLLGDVGDEQDVAWQGSMPSMSVAVRMESGESGKWRAALARMRERTARPVLKWGMEAL